MAGPAWQGLRDDWTASRREPRPGDIAVAWEAIWEIMPAGWVSSRPSYDGSSRLWCASAVRPTRVAVGPPVVVAYAPTGSLAIVEIARCITETVAGRLPE